MVQAGMRCPGPRSILGVFGRSTLSSPQADSDRLLESPGLVLPQNGLAGLEVDFDVPRRQILISRRLKNFVDSLYGHPAMGCSSLDGLCDHDRFQKRFQLDERLHEAEDGLLVACVFTCELHTHQKSKNSAQAHPPDGGDTAGRARLNASARRPSQKWTQRRSLQAQQHRASRPSTEEVQAPVLHLN